jgi:hypothetical protein
MAEALHLRRTEGKTQRLADAVFRIAVIVMKLARDRECRGRRLTGDDVDREPVGIGQPHDLAAARRRRGFHGDAFRIGQTLQILDALGVEAEPDESGLALLGHVTERPAVRASHIENVALALGPNEAELEQKRLHLVEVRRSKSHIGDICHADHESPPCLNTSRGTTSNGRARIFSISVSLTPSPCKITVAISFA